jgi:hypothetical protein
MIQPLGKEREMEERYPDLETILEEEEFLEPNIDQETLPESNYLMEVDNHYLVHPELIEIEEAFERCREVSSEKMDDHYFWDPGRLEIEEAIEEAQRISHDTPEIIRYLGPDEEQTP